MRHYPLRAQHCGLTVSRILVSVIRVLLLMGWVHNGLGQMNPAEGKMIRDVRVEGNIVVKDSKILGEIKSRSAAVFSEQQVSDDAQRLITMPEVYDVTWQVLEVGDGQVDLVFTVSETNRIRELRIEGNKQYKTNKLLKELDFKAGDHIDRYLIEMGARSLEAYYHNKGYYFATVTLDQEVLEKQQDVVYTVVEGPKLRINKVEYLGNDAFPNYKLGWKIKSKKYFPIFVKGKLDDDQIERDVQALETFYHEEGYLDAQVFARKEFNDEKTRVKLEFVVEEGPLYLLADMRFTGNKVHNDEVLWEATGLELGTVLKDKRLTFAQRAIKRIYGKDGYIYVRIVPELQYTDRVGEVDLVFKITEGESYALGKIIVQGNYDTQDKVIRRDFSRHDFLPGGLYNTDAAERARNRLLGSRLFENVTVNPKCKIRLRCAD